MENDNISTLKQKVADLKKDRFDYALWGDEIKWNEATKLIMDIEEKIEDFDQRTT